MNSKLSYDLNIDIMSRTSLRTLDALRCACKTLNTLSYDSFFLNMYKKRNNMNICGFLIQNIEDGWIAKMEFVPSSESKCLDLSFLPYGVRVLATSEQGIMVFIIKEMHYVCKPTTKQVMELPYTKILYTTEKLAIVVVSSNPLLYKIVRLCQPDCICSGDKLYLTYGCEIFDSAIWEWISIDRVKLPNNVFVTNPQPITMRGSVYMLLTNNVILKIDAYSEKWTVLTFPPIPTLEYQSDTSKQLLKYKGKLGFACTPPNGCLEIWVLTIDKLWEKMFVCDKKEDTEKKLLKALYDDCDNINKVVLNVCHSQMFPFRSDFEPTDFMYRRNKFIYFYQQKRMKSGENQKIEAEKLEERVHRKKSSTKKSLNPDV